MSRSMMPSQSQIEMLVDMLKKHRFLVTGHARTAFARDRTRKAWEEIAANLNSQGTGCIKTWKQWAKYWKDKKAALKKKVSQLNQARRGTGDVLIDEEICLSAVEEQLFNLVGSTGNRNLNATIEPYPMPQTPISAANDSPAIMKDSSLPAPAEAESAAEAWTSVMEPQPGPSGKNNLKLLTPIEPTQRAPESLGRRTNTTSATSSLNRRLMMKTRRRPLQRTPPTQHNSEMSNLIKRFIAIEERRVEVEMMFARSMDTLTESFNCTTQGFLQQSLALQSLAESIKVILDKVDQ